MSSSLIEQNSVVLREVKVGDRNLNINCIVLENEQTVTTKDGNLIKNFRIADRTGSMTLSLWDDQIGTLTGGEIIALQKAQTIIFRGCLQLNLMKGGSVTKRGEYCMLFLEMPFFSAYNPELEKLKVEPTVESAQNGSQSHIMKQDFSNSHRGATGGNSHLFNPHTPHQLNSGHPPITGSDAAARAMSHDYNISSSDHDNLSSFSGSHHHSSYQDHQDKNMTSSRHYSSANGNTASSDYHPLPNNHEMHKNLSGPQYQKTMQRTSTFHNNNNIYQNNNYGNNYKQMKNNHNDPNFGSQSGNNPRNTPRYPMGQNKWSNNNRGRPHNYSNHGNNNHNSGPGKFKKSKFSSPNAPY